MKLIQKGIKAIIILEYLTNQFGVLPFCDFTAETVFFGPLSGRAPSSR